MCGPWARRWPGARSHALFKSNDLEVMRIVLRAGQELPPHTVSGEITLQCLEGRIAFSLRRRPARTGAPASSFTRRGTNCTACAPSRTRRLLLTIVLPRRRVNR